MLAIWSSQPREKPTFRNCCICTYVAFAFALTFLSEKQCKDWVSVWSCSAVPAYWRNRHSSQGCQGHFQCSERALYKFSTTETLAMEQKSDSEWMIAILCCMNVMHLAIALCVLPVNCPGWKHVDWLLICNLLQVLLECATSLDAAECDDEDTCSRAKLLLQELDRYAKQRKGSFDEKWMWEALATKAWCPSIQEPPLEGMANVLA